jgi:putative lipase involved disintegration of autophagic bodies
MITLLNLTISVFCILSWLEAGLAQQQKAFQAPVFGKSLSFRHIYHHASYSGKYPGMFRRMDFSGEQAMTKADLMEKPLRFDVKQIIGKQYRPGSPLPHLMKAAQTPRQMHYAMGIHNMKLEYGLLPDVKDRKTVLALAEMTNNAYSDPDTREDWYDLGTKWNVVR